MIFGGVSAPADAICLAEASFGPDVTLGIYRPFIKVRIAGPYGEMYEAQEFFNTFYERDERMREVDRAFFGASDGSDKHKPPLADEPEGDTDCCAVAGAMLALDEIEIRLCGSNNLVVVA